MPNIITKMKQRGESYWEFTEWLKDVHSISVNLTINNEQKRKIFRRKLDKLSQVALDCHFKKIMQIIQKEKENCAQYKDSETQVNAIIMWLPRLKEKRDIVLKIIQKRRKNFKLAI